MTSQRVLEWWKEENRKIGYRLVVDGQVAGQGLVPEPFFDPMAKGFKAEIKEELS